MCLSLMVNVSIFSALLMIIARRFGLIFLKEKMRLFRSLMNGESW